MTRHNPSTFPKIGIKIAIDPKLAVQGTITIIDSTKIQNSFSLFFVVNKIPFKVYKLLTQPAMSSKEGGGKTQDAGSKTSSIVRKLTKNVIKEVGTNSFI